MKINEHNWSAALEHDEYENNLGLVIKDAIEAVEITAKGFYVNLVTPSNFGNPENFLSEPLESIFKDKINMKYIDQCGCGGYVLRVWKTENE